MEEETMTPQEIEDKKAIIAAVNKVFGQEARIAGVSTATIGRVISFLITAGRDVWPYLLDILKDLLRPSADDEPVPEPVEPPAEPIMEEPPTPEELPPTAP